MTVFLAFALKYWQWVVGVILIGLLVILYNVHVDGLIKAEVTKALTENNQSWQKSEQAAIAKAQAQAQEVEQAHQKDLADIAAQHAKDLANAKARHDKDVADARSGALRLRLAVASCGNSASVQAPPGASSVSNDPSPTAELSGSSASALYAIADDADAIAGQLSACQQIVISDRKFQ